MVRVKRVDHEGTVDFDRLGIVLPVDQHPSAKPANGRLARIVQHRIGPDRHKPLGRSEFVLVVLPRHPQFLDVP